MRDRRQDDVRPRVTSAGSAHDLADDLPVSVRDRAPRHGFGGARVGVVAAHRRAGPSGRRRARRRPPCACTPQPSTPAARASRRARYRAATSYARACPPGGDRRPRPSPPPGIRPRCRSARRDPLRDRQSPPAFRGKSVTHLTPSPPVAGQRGRHHLRVRVALPVELSLRRHDDLARALRAAPRPPRPRRRPWSDAERLAGPRRDRYSSVPLRRGSTCRSAGARSAEHRKGPARLPADVPRAPDRHEHGVGAVRRRGPTATTSPAPASPVASANTVSPSSIVCTGSMARARPSWAICASLLRLRLGQRRVGRDHADRGAGARPASSARHVRPRISDARVPRRPLPSARARAGDDAPVAGSTTSPKALTATSAPTVTPPSA